MSSEVEAHGLISRAIASRAKRDALAGVFGGIAERRKTGENAVFRDEAESAGLRPEPGLMAGERSQGRRICPPVGASTVVAKSGALWKGTKDRDAYV